MQHLVVPPRISAGARLAVVAPASPFDRQELFRGLSWLGMRYRLAISPRIFERSGYLAGDDARRSAELSRAMTDPAVDAIVCARGGYGAMRILDTLPWDAFVSRPKWIAGFSDVTALHLAANGRGIATVHGPNVTGLGRSITPAERLAFVTALERDPEIHPIVWRDLEVLRGGEATGPLVGGNLAMVSAMAAGGRLAIPQGAILALEDVTERPYRIDRMLTSLRLGGHLARASAIVFGSFTECDPGPDGVSVDEVLRERTFDLGVPVVRRAPFGHGAPNFAFVLGAVAHLDGDRLGIGAEASAGQPSPR